MEFKSTALIVACSARKKVSGYGSIDFRDLESSKDLDYLAESWLSSLDDFSDKRKASEVYVGGDWPKLRSLSQQGCDLYICSAGYGFVSQEEAIANYNATFTEKDPNFVGLKLPSDSTITDWINSISEVRTRARVPGLSDVIQSHQTVVIALPLGYLNAFWPLIRDALSVEVGRDVFVLCPSKFEPLKDHLSGVTYLYLDERWRVLLKCTRSTLATSGALYLLNSPSLLNHDALMEFDCSLPSAPQAKIKKKFENDEAVRDLLRHGWSSGVIPRQTTKALRYVRNTLGWSCEQSRFAKIVRELKAKEDSYGEG